MSDKIEFARHWGMPTANTFKCEPIKGFVQKYLLKSKVSVDPFARNCRWATWTNDMNPCTSADYHMEALEFLEKLKSDNIRADLVIFDPPYSPTQAVQCYKGLGKTNLTVPARAGGAWSKEKSAANAIMLPGAIFLWFGWNTCGMGKKRGFTIREILLVSHGRGKSDTICMAEVKLNHQQQALL